MNRYKLVKELGRGSFGTVVEATHVETGDRVAIKHIHNAPPTWKACLALREVKSLMRLKHTNIVKLKELIHEQGALYFVFEFLEGNLMKEITNGKPFDAERVRSVMRDLLEGLAFMHKHGFFHRDIKPENLLIAKDGTVKICDLGLARETRSRPPYTAYISTRWYRAPEVVLQATHYNSPVDVWAAGCIMAELFTHKPLFPGKSDVDQFYNICSVMGPPTAATWAEGARIANTSMGGLRLPRSAEKDLRAIVTGASPEALSLLRMLLHLDPNRRPTATQALSHPYFTGKDMVMGTPRVSVATPREEPPMTDRTIRDGKPQILSMHSRRFSAGPEFGAMSPITAAEPSPTVSAAMRQRSGSDPRSPRGGLSAKGSTRSLVGESKTGGGGGGGSGHRRSVTAAPAVGGGGVLTDTLDLSDLLSSPVALPKGKSEFTPPPLTKGTGISDVSLDASMFEELINEMEKEKLGK